MTVEVHDLAYVTAVGIAPHMTGRIIDVIAFRCVCGGVNGCIEPRKVVDVEVYVAALMERQPASPRVGKL